MSYRTYINGDLTIAPPLPEDDETLDGIFDDLCREEPNLTIAFEDDATRLTFDSEVKYYDDALELIDSVIEFVGSRGRVLNGQVIGQEDAHGDYWKVVVTDNARKTAWGEITYGEPE